MQKHTLSLIYNKTIRQHQKELVPGSYAEFRRVVNKTSAVRVKKRGLSTLLFDQYNHLIAKIDAAGIDQRGHCQATRYFICAQDLIVAA